MIEEEKWESIMMTTLMKWFDMIIMIQGEKEETDKKENERREKENLKIMLAFEHKVDRFR